MTLSSSIVVMDLDGTLIKMKFDIFQAKKRAAEAAKQHGLELRENESIQDFLDRAAHLLPP
ncbi:MAG: hypothetical protein NYU39_01200, partial [Aigarchaeota archaeon]|nr:hypothetical protein [Candidatus Caldarchaeales archaeon]